MYFFAVSPSIKNPLFSTEERQYIGSFDTWVVKDQDIIKAFARDVSQGSYRSQINKDKWSWSPGLKIICYRNGERITSFEAWYGIIITEDGREFKYPLKLKIPDLSILEPPELRPFLLRYYCRLGMGQLYLAGPLHKKVSSYPDPNQWCDAVLEALQNQYFYAWWGRKKRKYSDTRIARMFTCPSVRESTEAEDTDARPSDPNLTKRIKPLWESHFAMNSNCELNSPPDTVLLFETKADWNKHGGPELFTFDNHDPRGGCVYFNDHTAKFIRTKEELQQLRWK